VLITGGSIRFSSADRLADAQPRHLVGRQLDRLLALDPDRTGPRAGQADDGAQGGGAAGAVAPEQADHLAFMNGQVDAVQDVGFAVPRVQVLDAQELIRHQCAPCRAVSVVPM
jgi:hypothetical protein